MNGKQKYTPQTKTNTTIYMDMLCPADTLEAVSTNAEPSSAIGTAASLPLSVFMFNLCKPISTPVTQLQGIPQCVVSFNWATYSTAHGHILPWHQGGRVS